jgi:hypothetical protein
MTTLDHRDSAAAAGVRAAEEARRQAMLAGNSARLGELLADTLVYTHATGVQDSKPGYLLQLLSGALRYEALEFVTPGITVLGSEPGSVVLVDAVMQATVLRGETRRQVANSYLAVWENTPSGWKLQAVQATALPVAA